MSLPDNPRDFKSLEDFYRAVNQLLEQTLAGANKQGAALAMNSSTDKPISPDIIARLAMVERLATALNMMNTALVKSSGTSQEEIDKIIANYESLPPREQRMMKLTKVMQRKVNAMRRDIAIAASVAQKKKQFRLKNQQSRKNKLARAGYTSKWKRI